MLAKGFCLAGNRGSLGLRLLFDAWEVIFLNRRHTIAGQYHVPAIAFSVVALLVAGCGKEGEVGVVVGEEVSAFGSECSCQVADDDVVAGTLLAAVVALVDVVEDFGTCIGCDVDGNDGILRVRSEHLRVDLGGIGSRIVLRNLYLQIEVDLLFGGCGEHLAEEFCGG